MEGVTIVDGVALLVVAISALLAYSRGLVREVLSIAGWLLAAVAAFYFAPQVKPLIEEVPGLRDLIGSSCQLGMLAAFAVVLAASLILISLFTPLFSDAVQRSALGALDQGLGFLFGAARGVLLVAIALLIYEQVPIDATFDQVESSRTKEVLADLNTTIREQLPNEVPGWVNVRYEQFLGACQETAPAPAAAPTTGADTPVTTAPDTTVDTSN
ncbi:MAG: CvpA family protein [Pseudomonadota bacterium]